MSRKLSICIAVLSLIAVCLSVFSLITVLRSPKAQTPAPAVTAEEEAASPSDADRDVQYVMYIGTNDKDTNEPVCTPDEAKEKVEAILIRHFGGYTMQEAEGGWVDDNGKQYNEFTVVVYLSDTGLDAVHSAADEIIAEFNQSSVLIQANETKTEFYSTAAE